MNNLYNQLNHQNSTQGINNIEQIKNMMNMLRSAQDPKLMLETLIRQNPQLQNVMNIIRQNGGDPKTAFYNLAKEKGVDPEEIIGLLR